jgi:hypothetical protein
VDPDIEEKSRRGVETLVRYGEGVATATTAPRAGP